MKFVISYVALFVFSLQCTLTRADDLRSSVLRQSALDGGLIPVEQLLPNVDKKKSEAGKLLFESKELSLTREIACKNCHLDRFASADGIPLGIGTRGGEGEGIERMKHGGDMLPRNTLPFWGRGGIGFNTFFWDGRVDGQKDGIISQFGSEPPSSDPLVVAVHLPTVQIKEMIRDDDAVEYLRQESLDAALQVYRTIEGRVIANEPISDAVSAAFNIPKTQITYVHLAECIAAFIRDRFQLKSTRLHDFVFSGLPLEESEIEGGLIFYGRGKCIGCHSGPYFTDFDFHALPFEQFGRGMNGFGVDYGRYNVTANPNDMYKFRTPPLYNVHKTAPYSHSGVEYEIKAAIRTHVDPLANKDFSKMNPNDRNEFYSKLSVWANEGLVGVQLSDSDIDRLSDFLNTLSFADSIGSQ